MNFVDTVADYAHGLYDFSTNKVFVYIKSIESLFWLGVIGYTIAIMVKQSKIDKGSPNEIPNIELTGNKKDVGFWGAILLLLIGLLNLGYLSHAIPVLFDNEELNMINIASSVGIFAYMLPFTLAVTGIYVKQQNERGVTRTDKIVLGLFWAAFIVSSSYHIGYSIGYFRKKFRLPTAAPVPVATTLTRRDSFPEFPTGYASLFGGRRRRRRRRS